MQIQIQSFVPFFPRGINGSGNKTLRLWKCQTFEELMDLGMTNLECGSAKPLRRQDTSRITRLKDFEHSKMSTAKKAKMVGGRSFQETWTESFGVIECKGKALCIMCNESVDCWISGVRRHFETNHRSVAKLGETARKEFLEGKLRKYHSQYLASFHMSLCIAKHSESLSDGDIFKTAGAVWE
ncbi:uncharacterized protein LOC121931891 isoform X3 [Sceloporus undulatus]|uniref:uncharacterized protein LOC121931891 isoform X3 n=1 Tax=Sceloporus undulatus TaxID=8520 RepID=UPI001C4CDD45|nr:uncharacterized protein LOC121931891 isoform X3 [Sceloporus undulatus]